MITQIDIQNFKCLKHKSLSFEALTLLTGFNAAGKSSTLQSLLLGAQLMQQQDKSAISLNGRFAKLGRFSDVLCTNADEKHIKLSFSDDQSCLSLNLSSNAENEITGARKLLLQESLPETNNITRSLQQLIYVSALRSLNYDYYPIPDEVNPVFASVGELGQFAPWWFNQNKEAEIQENRCFQAQNDDEFVANTLQAQMDAWAGEFFPGVRCNTFYIDRSALVGLEFVMGDRSSWRRPANIGYGLSYVFPILVAGLLAEPGQIVVIDSPEAHLHPRAQSRMGYFLGVMAAAGVQIVIETHSDHVLNGVRLAVAQNKIAKNKVAIHFFTHLDAQSHSPNIISPRVNDTGELSEWPDGFFDQTEKDLMALNGWG